MALVQKEVKKVYLGSTKVRPEGWEPGANCVAYYPLEDDFNDYSGNNYNLTNNGIVLGTSTDGYKAGQIGPEMYASTTAFNFFSAITQRTIAFWVGCNSVITGSWSVANFLTASDSVRTAGIGWTTYNYTGRGLGNLWMQEIGYIANANPDTMVNLIDANQMHSYVLTIDQPNNEFKIYKDGEYVTTKPITNSYNSTPVGFGVGCRFTDTGFYPNGYIRQVVIDNSVWTASDVTAYHSGTA